MLNRIICMGRLTRDPELRYTQSNVPVCSFTVAVDRDYTQNGEKQSDFIDCVAWRAGGEFVSKYFQQGSLIVVDGRLESRKWQDRDGNKRTSWEINVDHSYFGGSKREDSNPGGYSAPQSGPSTQASAQVPQQQGFTDLPDDDSDGELPF